MDLYFDSSVYGFIEARNEARAVRKWLREAGHTLVASDEANIGEALRIRNGHERAARVQAIFQTGAGLAARPTDLVAAEEMLGELMRVRRAWVREYPSLKSKSVYLRHRMRTVWDELRRDPYYLPAATSLVLPALEQIVGENKDAQKARRQAIRAGYPRTFKIPSRPDLTALMNGYPDLESYTRNQLYVDFTYLLQQGVAASAETDWLAPHLDFDDMFRDPEGPWLDFWFKEVDPIRMPGNVLSILAEKQQDQYQITAGNTFDRIHSAYLEMADRVVTADRDLYNVMVYAAGVVKPRGLPALIDRSASSVIAELQAAIP